MPDLKMRTTIAQRDQWTQPDDAIHLMEEEGHEAVAEVIHALCADVTMLVGLLSERHIEVAAITHEQAVAEYAAISARLVQIGDQMRQIEADLGEAVPATGGRARLGSRKWRR